MNQGEANRLMVQIGQGAQERGLVKRIVPRQNGADWVVLVEFSSGLAYPVRSPREWARVLTKAMEEAKRLKTPAGQAAYEQYLAAQQERLSTKYKRLQQEIAEHDERITTAENAPCQRCGEKRARKLLVNPLTLEVLCEDCLNAAMLEEKGINEPG